MLTTLLYILFCFSAFVLIVVILLQEGKGGGFGQALGDHGQQTFGVGSKGINTFTGVTAAVFLASALTLHFINRSGAEASAIDGLTTIGEGLQGLGDPGLAGDPDQE